MRKSQVNTIIWIIICLIPGAFGHAATYTMGTSGSQSATITATSGSPDKFYDDGGSGGNYSNSVNASFTFNCAVGKYVRIKNNSFTTQTNSDRMTLYDGTSTSARMMGFLNFSGSFQTCMFVSTTGSITVKFQTNASVNNTGWDFDVWIDDIPGQFWIGGTSTNTNDAANWEANVLPYYLTNVYIPTGTSFSPDLSNTTANLKMANLYIASGAIFNYSSSLYSLYVFADITVNGTINHTSSNYLIVNGGLSSDYALLKGSGDLSSLKIKMGSDLYITYYKQTNDIVLAELVLNNAAGGCRYDMNYFNLFTSNFTSVSSTTFYQRTGNFSISNNASIVNASFNEGTGTTIFTASSAQTIPAITYYNLSTTGVGTKSLASNTLDVNGDLNIGATSTLDVVSYNITVGKNWVNDGIFIAGSGTVTFDGNSAQTISGSNSPTFNNATINNTSTGVNLGCDAVISNTLTFVSGTISAQGYTLELGILGLSPGSISGNSTSKYIIAYDDGAGTIGYFKRYILATGINYELPIGDNANYLPMNINFSAATFSNAALTCFTKASKIPGLNPSITSYLDRYWDLEPEGISSFTYDIDYTFVDGDVVGSKIGMLPVKLSGVTWYKPTGSSFLDGTIQGVGTFDGSNLLTWTGLTSFSLYSGAVDEGVLLPIFLANFEVDLFDDVVLLRWETSSEEPNSYFTIERSSDGKTFKTINRINGLGTSTQKVNYLIVDKDYFRGINYYRLNVHDENEIINDSRMLSIDLSQKMKLVVKTVNTLGQEVDSTYKGLVFDIFEDKITFLRMQ